MKKILVAAVLGLVYRRKTAACELAGLGYTGISEFGGSNPWPYEVEQAE